MKDILNRTRWIWAVTYAFLTGMAVGQRHWLGVVLLAGGGVLDRAFVGFAALPEKASQPWREVLGIPSAVIASEDVIETRFRELARVHHPDRGGNAEKFHEIVQARDAARLEVRG
jgi:hypothetical protein